MGVLWSDLILLGMGMFPSRKGNIKTKKNSPYIFLANHASMIDVMLLVSTVRTVSYTHLTLPTIYSV